MCHHLKVITSDLKCFTRQAFYALHPGDNYDSNKNTEFDATSSQWLHTTTRNCQVMATTATTTATRQFQLPLITLEMPSRPICLIRQNVSVSAKWNAAGERRERERQWERERAWRHWPFENTSIRKCRYVCMFAKGSTRPQYLDEPSHFTSLEDGLVCLQSFRGGALHKRILFCNCHKVTKWHFMIVINNTAMTVIKNK